MIAATRSASASTVDGQSLPPLLHRAQGPRTLDSAQTSTTSRLHRSLDLPAGGILTLEDAEDDETRVSRFQDASSVV